MKLRSLIVSLMLFFCSALKIPSHIAMYSGVSARARSLIGVGGWARETFQLGAKKKGGLEEKFVCESCGVEHREFAIPQRARDPVAQGYRAPAYHHT